MGFLCIGRRANSERNLRCIIQSVLAWVGLCLISLCRLWRNRKMRFLMITALTISRIDSAESPLSELLTESFPNDYNTILSSKHPLLFPSCSHKRWAFFLWKSSKNSDFLSQNDSIIGEEFSSQLRAVCHVPLIYVYRCPKSNQFFSPRLRRQLIDDGVYLIGLRLKID